jgi:hypothetical protein
MRQGNDDVPNIRKPTVFSGVFSGVCLAAFVVLGGVPQKRMRHGRRPPSNAARFERKLKCLAHDGNKDCVAKR